ncbi:MAG: hypothetical protein AAFY26_11675, partial [Cyanobacteria bacterium J06638_22]
HNPSMIFSETRGGYAASRKKSYPQPAIPNLIIADEIIFAKNWVCPARKKSYLDSAIPEFAAVSKSASQH